MEIIQRIIGAGMFAMLLLSAPAQAGHQACPATKYLPKDTTCTSAVVGWPMDQHGDLIRFEGEYSGGRVLNPMHGVRVLDLAGDDPIREATFLWYMTGQWEAMVTQCPNGIKEEVMIEVWQHRLTYFKSLYLHLKAMAMKGPDIRTNSTLAVMAVMLWRDQDRECWPEKGD